MQKVSESVGKRDQKLPENRNNHDLSPLAACQSSFRKKNNSVIILLKTRKKKKYCRDPGLFRAHASSPDLNQGPSDLQSDVLPTELSRQLVNTVN